MHGDADTYRYIPETLKLYPGQLQIDVVERSPFALWQQDGRLSVISDDGAVLEPYVTRRFTSLPLVVGKGADTRARDFLALLARYPQVRAATKAAWSARLRGSIEKSSAPASSAGGR